MTARPATMAPAVMPPFAPPESPPVEDAMLVLVDVGEAVELAVELDMGAPWHVNDPLMPLLM
jgi:hypothetical protein